MPEQLPDTAITAAAKALRVYYGEPDVTVKNYDRLVTLVLEAAASALRAQGAAAERARNGRDARVRAEEWQRNHGLVDPPAASGGSRALRWFADLLDGDDHA